MSREFEIVQHNQIRNFRLFLVNLLYRTPHVHKDFEICLILDGEIEVHLPQSTRQASRGDIFVLNPFVPHELKARQPATILSLQIAPAFFASYYPQINSLQIDTRIQNASAAPSFQELFDLILKLAHIYFQKSEGYELICTGMINIIFFHILQLFPHELTGEDQSSQSARQRVRQITEYIDEHFSEKILLTDISKKLGLSLYYVSHFFKDHFGISFQDYLSKMRCEKARQLLLLTDQALLDISLAAGFSDSKYFNRAFQKQYGCTPKEYRKTFEHESLPLQQISMLTAQEFLSDKASLVLLDKYSPSL